MMTQAEIDKIERQALSFYGSEMQTRMTFEEMAELQKELCKWWRGAQNRENIAEEIADVQIMLDQMTMLFELGKEVEDYKSIKIRRLRERMEKEREEDWII